MTVGVIKFKHLLKPYLQIMIDKDLEPRIISRTGFPALISSSDDALFSKKELYIQSHTSNGKATFLNTKRPARYRYDNMHLVADMKMTSYAGLSVPQLDAYTGPLEFEAIPFSKRAKSEGKNQAVHFFENDDCFRYATWDRLEQTSLSLSKFDVLFTPDYSMFIDECLTFQGFQAVYMNRFVGAYWQQTCGFNVIPTFTFGNADSLKYSMIGLPKYSPLAVCGVGVNHCRASRNLWEYALRTVEKELSPTLFYVYGPETSVPGLHTPIIFIEDYITKHFRHGKAI